MLKKIILHDCIELLQRLAAITAIEYYLALRNPSGEENAIGLTSDKFMFLIYHTEKELHVHLSEGVKKNG